MQDSTSFFMSMDVYRLCANSRYDILILDYTLGENNPERRILKVIIKRLELWENTTKLLGVKGMTANVIQVVASAATTAASTVTEATTEGKLDIGDKRIFALAVCGDTACFQIIRQYTGCIYISQIICDYQQCADKSTDN